MCRLHFLYFCLISQFLIFNKAKPLIGQNVKSAEPNEYPFIASIGLKILNNLLGRNHICGGSLITRTHVLTVAHCFEKYTINQVNVVIGEINLITARFYYEIQSLTVYNDWALANGKTLEYQLNDIAILRLTSSVDRGGITPVKITPLNAQQLYGKNAIIVGWGYTKEERIADVLQKANVRILSSVQCEKQVQKITNRMLLLERNHMCTLADPYVLATRGDSGGPLLSEANHLVGIIRDSCPNETAQWGGFSTEFLNNYKVNRYVRVDYFRNFIENVTNLVTRPREVLSLLYFQL